MTFNFKELTVFGAGTMGAGIAQWFAQQGLRVDLIDRELEISETSVARVYAAWDKLQAKNKFTPAQVEIFKANLVAIPQKELKHKTPLVIEAIFEDLSVKRELFNYLDQHCDEETIIASNTSSFLISSLCKELTRKRQERFIGMHFFNPAVLMKLVEVISSPWTSDQLKQNIGAWLEDLGKKVAYCQESPGFIVNRVARNFYGEPMRIVRKNTVSEFKEIDKVMREVGGFRMGPFELMDLIGIDINFAVTQSVWHAYFHEPRFAPHPLQQMMVESGRLGKKTKEGFYPYE